MAISSKDLVYLLDFIVFATFPVVIILLIFEGLRTIFGLIWPSFVFIWPEKLFSYLMWPKFTDEEEDLSDSTILQNDFLQTDAVTRKNIVEIFRVVESTYYSNVDYSQLTRIDDYCVKYMNHQFTFLQNIAQTNAILTPDLLDANEFLGPYENQTVRYTHVILLAEKNNPSHKWIRVRAGNWQLMGDAWSLFNVEGDMPFFKKAKIFKAMVEEKAKYYRKTASQTRNSIHVIFTYNLILDKSPDNSFMFIKPIDFFALYWFLVLFYGFPWLVGSQKDRPIRTNKERFFLPYYQEFVVNAQHAREKFFLSLLTDAVLGRDVETFDDFVRDLKKKKFTESWAGIRRKNTLLEFRRYESARMYERLIRANAILYFDEALRQIFYAPIYNSSNIFEMNAAQLRQKN